VLASADFAQQMADAKASNDYVIIDSPALSEYSDGYQLATFADVTLYVVKAGTARKSDIEALNSNNNIPNPLIVFNV
jgi:Mrp family chromosome partitioning ATPase